MSKAFNLHIPISKVDEEQRMVWGIATSEAIDSQGDIVDYEASKVAFSNWLGNIREMHQPVAVGKAIDIQYNDETKEVMIGAKISESADGENAWLKVKEGVLNGFSIGGSVSKVSKEVAKDKNGNDTPVTRVVEYSLSETSLVDNPANPDAMFVMVKSQKGGLQRVEHEATEKELHKGFQLPAWHIQFMMPMEKAQSLYDKSMKKAGVAVVDSDPRNASAATVAEVTAQAPVKGGTKVTKPVYAVDGKTVTNKSKGNETMGKKIEKGMWDASFLLDLAIELGYYINGEQYEGEDVADLESALATIKAAVVKELTEVTPELTTAVELAQKVSTLAKAKAADITKGNVVGGEERDAAAEVVTTAEEAGRPVNDTEERAAEAGVKPAVEGEAPVHVDEASVAAADAKEKQDAAETDAPAAVNDVVEEAPVEKPAEAPAEKEVAPVETDKAATIGDLKKFTDGLINKLSENNKTELSKVLGEFSDKVEKSITSLEDRVKNIENQPATPKAKSSFVEIEKGKEGSPVSEETDVASLLKRQDELMRDPNSGTAAERMELAQALRKAQSSGADLSAK